MATPWNIVISRFFQKIEKDLDFFVYNNVSSEEADEIAKTRAKGYLKEAVVKLLTSCTPDISFVFDEQQETFNDDLTEQEIDLIASLMREKYFEKDMSLLKAFQVRFSPKDLQVFSPANERKTFMDMFIEIVNENSKAISRYTSRDRITGKLKTINYEVFMSD